MSAFLNMTRKKYTIKKCRNCQIELTTFPQYEGKNAMQEKMSIKIVAISFFLMTSLRLQEKNIFLHFLVKSNKFGLEMFVLKTLLAFPSLLALPVYS